MQIISALSHKRIVLIITGSRNANIFNSFYLASLLSEAGANADVILTPEAAALLSSLAFASNSQARSADQDDPASMKRILYSVWGRDVDLLVIVPCNQPMLSALVEGVVENLPVVEAPMRRFPILVVPCFSQSDGLEDSKRLHTLSQHKVYIVEPRTVQDRRPSGSSDDLVEPLSLLGHIRLALGGTGRLAGKKLVVTAGATYEFIDPVRLITNRSSGKQGYALAQAALDQGAEVILITTPTSLDFPLGAEILQVESANRMLAAVLDASAKADGLLMVAAVADFRPSRPAHNKLKKRNGIPHIELEFTPDILSEVAGPSYRKLRPKVVVAFAAETDNVLENATSKIKSKKVDFIAANDISSSDSGFRADTNRVTLLYANGRQESLPLMSKAKVAEIICERVAEIFQTTSIDDVSQN